MIDYLTIKAVHVSCASLSFFGLAARFLCAYFKPHFLDLRWVKITPHIIDSLLLVSALLIISPWLQTVQPWLIAKLAVLTTYIYLGHLAIDLKRPPKTNVYAFLFSAFAFAYIALTAKSKDPLGFLGL